MATLPGDDRYRTVLEITPDGQVPIPAHLRERHFEEDDEPDFAEMQATGNVLRATMWSNRDSIQLLLPMKEWYANSPTSRSLSGSRLNVRRWVDKLDAQPRDDGAQIPVTVVVLEQNWRSEDYE